jgi:hypothetical protein
MKVGELLIIKAGGTYSYHWSFIMNVPHVDCGPEGRDTVPFFGLRMKVIRYPKRQ